MQKKITLTLLLLSTALLSSCSSMYGNTSRIVNVQQAKPNTPIYINGSPSAFATSPQGTATVAVPSTWGDTLVQVGRNGSSRAVETEFDTIGILNILNIPLGFIVDAATGNMMTISPTSRYLNFAYQQKK